MSWSEKQILLHIKCTGTKKVKFLSFTLYFISIFTPHEIIIPHVASPPFLQITMKFALPYFLRSENPVQSTNIVVCGHHPLM